MKIVNRFWRRTRFRYRVHRGLVVDLALAILGVVLLWPGQSIVKDGIGLACTVIGTWRFAQGLAERWERYRRISIVENPFYLRALAACEWPDGFDLHGADRRLPHDGRIERDRLIGADPDTIRPYLTSPAVNAQLDGASSPLTIEPRRYKVSDRLIQYQFHSLGLFSPHDNEEKVGLRTDPTPELLSSGRPIHIQHTDYFSGTASNEMATKQFELVREDGLGPPVLLASTSDAIIARGRLIDLEGSELSNHIGVSTLLLSEDNQLIIQRQGDQNVSAGQLGPGASGSLDRHDLRSAGHPPTLQALCRIGMEREATEEVGARFSAPGQATVLTGYARYLLRGGKPEFFGISRSITSRRKLRRGTQESRYVKAIEPIGFDPHAPGLIDTIDRLLEDGWDARDFGVSLIVCLRLARAWLETAPPDALARIGLAPDRSSAPAR